MAADVRPELSSLSTMLDDVTTRLAEIAESAANDDESAAPELFEIERDLQSASRRLAKLISDLA
ncbi:MAG TPA: hypothetical protein VM345_06220 [Acidimicrobiales bacterium]|jgi:hypothetical protein|nr:hypothetical protein [Acidimicrobiales bacterium]